MTGAYGRIVRPSHFSIMGRAIIAALVLVPAVSLVTVGTANASVGDPVQKGCSSDAYTVSTQPITNWGGGVVGQVQLRYSPHCGTNWAKVVSNIGNADLEAEVYTSTDSAFYEATSTSVYTDMVSAPTPICAYAFGSINGGPLSADAIGC